MPTADSTFALTRHTRAAAYLDWLQMLSGAVLILFMWAHLILVASVIIGPGVMDAIAWFFEATYMVQIGGPVIGLIFLFHFVMAARKAPFRAREQRAFWKHSRQMRHADTWLWLVQVVSAMVILIMGATHMWVVLTDLPITAAKSAARIQNGWWLAFYLVLLPMVELHVSVGFYRIGVKWGFIRRDNRARMKKVEKYMIIGFISIGLLALLRFSLLAV
jgi:fumarate reductase subunit C